eukprot:TRINITY_DN4719_c0_g1_i1.p1 TRINITY_DN4719_c0_g1~~TRINITY_DN4719_c0_g1_i1.p1  ORF type:complete len:896 (-),score=182.09 TRINITY_DN4719_c0_g1_i1:269-2956(-)
MGVVRAVDPLVELGCAGEMAAAAAPDENVASKVRFETLCRLLQRVSDAPGAIAKTRLLTEFYERVYRTDDTHPVMRLVVPELDRDRVTYGLKQSSIAKSYLEVLSIDAGSTNGKILLNWKNPTIVGPRTAAGDFAAVVQSVLENYISLPAGKLSIADVNDLLDRLSTATDRKVRAEVWATIVNNTTAFEQAWVIRIILHDMKLGIGSAAILNHYHPNASDLYNNCNDLRRVCAELADPRSVTKGPMNEISVGQPIKPMLARKDYEQQLEVLRPGEFIVEPKLDGERIHCHIDGDSVSFWTRNANDYSQSYSDMKQIVRENVRPRRCILDGEMVSWDPQTQQYVPFGHNRTVAKATLNQPVSDTTRHLCYIVFDILYADEKNLMNEPLFLRKKILKESVNIVTHWIEVIETWNGNTKEEVMEHLDRVISLRHEGLVIKNLRSLYLPGERNKSGWTKIKQDYVEGLAEHFDLLVLGGYYGEGRRRAGDISSFLLGVAGPQRDPDGHPYQFWSFCKVGTGYNFSELTEIRTELARHWRQWSNSNIPPHFAGWVPGPGEKPDVWIDPRKSLIIEMKGFEVVPSEKFRTRCTLRFPRAVRLRRDKSWFECLTQEELFELQSEAQKGKKRTAGPHDEEKKKKKPKIVPTLARAAPTVLAQYRDTDVSGVERTGQLFLNIEFCVLQCDGHITKQELEREIVRHGGKKVQNPGINTNYIIAANLQNVRLQTLVKLGTTDIHHTQWVLDCIAQQRLLGPEPKYMLFTTPKTRLAQLQIIDRFGDAYSTPTDAETLRSVMRHMKRCSDSTRWRSDLWDVGGCAPNAGDTRSTLSAPVVADEIEEGESVGLADPPASGTDRVLWLFSALEDDEIEKLATPHSLFRSFVVLVLMFKQASFGASVLPH